MKLPLAAWRKFPPSRKRHRQRSRLVTTTAPATAAIAASTTSTTVAAAAATTAAAALGLRARLVDRQRAAVHLVAVHRLDGRLRFRVAGHLHEPEPLGAARVAVHDDLRRHDTPVRCEYLLQIA